MEIGRGAEAILLREGNKLVKHRIKKSYRIREIDEELRKRRTKNEMKLLNEARRIGVNVPMVVGVDEKEMKIEMEFLEGKVLKEWLDKLGKDRESICREIGRQIALLHKANIIHGDLTTSNMILSDGKVYFIDFGLGFFSNKIEDKACDLHLLKEALISAHHNIWKKCFNLILKAYKKELGSEADDIFLRLKEIGSRGRYF
ncbi:MAG: KEOPS complex kinase/ATPase Bud32 [Candidatus Parvarchaeota archaeon]|nr:KEOPS complex kinase/ATPase Bud32 [Candidatus Jingweiarchaeum tengchongense]MCW1297685.1 KEOPS complex kinase/ATPase Bud32 [Candidatus Jingweiarchaeum tengchongense]MCW1299696.1 KEOPS complex kinase/ATPase Bud32 [Candidatus Jingweiarchaeum tengchongense]MCW1304336.1 KEOPS complex kinase/ATPase Bud32 [Candidatus Jingweiarchaeum tengchongense]MCW1305681.1 KEOPS complex kinase/ATPase Bud32 [Candidatus Jingweiarchaeum tengchongense]